MIVPESSTTKDNSEIVVNETELIASAKGKTTGAEKEVVRRDALVKDKLVWNLFLRFMPACSASGVPFQRDGPSGFFNGLTDS